jgi:hypothetical protein
MLIIALRLVKRALEDKKPILLLNIGPTRADGLPGVEKIELPTTGVLRGAVKILRCIVSFCNKN